jgi:hypothetical protein
MRDHGKTTNMRVFAFERKYLLKYTTYREINYGFRIFTKTENTEDTFLSRNNPRNFAIFRDNSYRVPSKPYPGLIWYLRYIPRSKLVMQQTHLIMPFNDMKKNQLDSYSLHGHYGTKDNKEEPVFRILYSFDTDPAF